MLRWQWWLRRQWQQVQRGLDEWVWFGAQPELGLLPGNLWLCILVHAVWMNVDIGLEPDELEGKAGLQWCGVPMMPADQVKGPHTCTNSMH